MLLDVREKGGRPASPNLAARFPLSVVTAHSVGHLGGVAVFRGHIRRSGKRGGRPCIRGMRITVYDVLSYLAAGMTIAEVLDDFPYLTPEDIQACFAFAAEREWRMLVAVA